jgi:hypothetical protein
MRTSTDRVGRAVPVPAGWQGCPGPASVGRGVGVWCRPWGRQERQRRDRPEQGPASATCLRRQCGRTRARPSPTAPSCSRSRPRPADGTSRPSTPCPPSAAIGPPPCRPTFRRPRSRPLVRTRPARPAHRPRRVRNDLAKVLGTAGIAGLNVGDSTRGHVLSRFSVVSGQPPVERRKGQGRRLGRGRRAVSTGGDGISVCSGPRRSWRSVRRGC